MWQGTGIQVKNDGPNLYRVRQGIGGTWGYLSGMHYMIESFLWELKHLPRGKK